MSLEVQEDYMITYNKKQPLGCKTGTTKQSMSLFNMVSKKEDWYKGEAK